MILGLWREDKKEEVQVDNKEGMTSEQKMILKDREKKLSQTQGEIHTETEETLTGEEIVTEVKVTGEEKMVKEMTIEVNVETIVKEITEGETMAKNEENTEITESQGRREITTDSPSKLHNKILQKMEKNIDLWKVSHKHFFYRYWVKDKLLIFLFC